MIRAFIAAFVLWGTVCGSAPASAKDERAGYYYPEPKKIETYRARAKTLPGANRTRRIAFVTGLVTNALRRPYPPPYSIFAKGNQGDKLIIVSNYAGQLDTIYRVRAMLASLTSMARTLPIFREFSTADRLNFFDLGKMLGFKMITVSDGDKFSHQVLLK